jgi:DNA invertase Pin-like site-specific DNA recombinase
MTAQPDTPTQVVAFIYDRHVTPYPEGLRARLEACSGYALARGWEIGGWHIDKGDDALTPGRRPALDAALLAMERTEGTRRVLLIASLDRLHNNPVHQGRLTARVEVAGGEVFAVDTADLPVEGVAR